MAPAPGRKTFPLRRAGGGAFLLASLLVVALALSRSGLTSPEATYLLRDRDGRFLGEVAAPASRGAPRDVEFGYWPLRALPQRVVAATLAVEDRRFFTHPGVDPISLARAAAQDLRHLRRVSGASTLAMQVARMQAPGRRTLLRKGVEALTALIMTWRHGRQAVLEQYLRIVPYGNRIHGIEYAARRYLDKPVDDLSWAETAFLTAIPLAPGRMNPFEPDGRLAAIARGRRILRLLRRQSVLSREEYQLATVEIGRLRIPSHGVRPDSAIHTILRFEEVLRDPEARRRLSGRTVVTTTLDLQLQQKVSSFAADAVAAWESQGAGNAAVIVVDRPTNEVLSWVGSTGYRDERHAGAFDYARLPRSPGSALKPFLYAYALERGTITPATILPDLDRGAGGIINADDLFLGPLLPRVALANSRNVPAADLLDRIGLEEGYAFLRDLRLHEGERPARRYGLGLAIGGLPVTLERLVDAYTAFSSDGRLRDLVWYDGQPLRLPKRVLSEETARQVALFLSDPMARLPSFPRMGPTEYPFPVAVKTGTSSRFRDAWTVAVSTRYVVGVWVGHPDFKPMNRLSGYRSAAELSQRILTSLHRDQCSGLQDLSFPPPRGFRAVRLCGLTGQLPTPACEHIVVEWLRPGQEPVENCTAHVQLAVDARTGLLATRATPRRYVKVQTFVDLPPRYASWQAAAGLPRPPARASSGWLVPRAVPSDAYRLSGVAAPAAPVPLTAGMTSRVRITAPDNGVTLLADPETPRENSTLALHAVADPPVRQVVWYVDGTPFQVADYPYTVRWPLAPGDHTFQARLPYQALASAPVRIRVR